MFRELLLLTLVISVSGEESLDNLQFKKDSDYLYMHRLYDSIEYISVDGVNISKAGEGSNCVAPNDCWQLIRRGRYLIALGELKGNYAAFTMHPADSARHPSVAVQYKRAGTPEYPPLTNGVISVFAREFVENQRFLHLLLFNADIGTNEV
nr:unnamed protein product [Spirometra erinaceieuropaei]